MVRTKKQALAGVSCSQPMQTHDSRDPPIPITMQGYPQQACNAQGLIDVMQRERERKMTAIQSAFPTVSYEEADVMLMDCAFREDEVIGRLSTRPDYLEGIRRIVGSMAPPQDAKISRANTPPTPVPNPLTMTPPTAAKKSDKRTRLPGGRLALDDALRQVQSSTSVDEAYEGWSQARIRAFQMIDENPNSYYYRFNAPGQEQRKGAWTQEERELFFARLREVGANGQWGIFSTAIPGRVGYQCSNYYRLLIQTGQVHDPNYVVDERGKVHYLFEKRSADGIVQKTFRTHSPHQFAKKKTAAAPSKKKKQHGDGDTSGSFSVGIRKSARLAAAGGRNTRSTHQVDE